MKKNIYAFIVANLFFVGVGFGQTTTAQIYTPNGTTVLPTQNNINATAGYVGIGTALPTRPLQVGNGTTNLVSTDNSMMAIRNTQYNVISVVATGVAGIGAGYGGSLLQLVSDDQTNRKVGNRLGGIQFAGSTTNSAVAFGASIEARAEADWGSSSSPTYLSFHTTPSNTTSRVEVARISSTGNVGIGVIAPTTKLDVAGTINTNTGFTLNNTNGTTITTIKIAPSVGINYKLRYTQGGADYSVNGNGLTLTGSGVGSYKFGSENGKYGLHFSPPSSTFVGDYHVFNGSNNPLILGTNNLERMRIAGNGNVGIGTTSPYYPLSVQTNTFANTKISLWDNGTATVAPTLIYGIGVQLNQFRFHLSSSTNRFTFLNAPAGTSSNELLTINGDGNFTSNLRNTVTTNGGGAKFIVDGSMGHASEFSVKGQRTFLSVGMAIGRNATAATTCDGCYSSIAKTHDIVIANRDFTATGATGSQIKSHLILTNHNHEGSIKFTTKNNPNDPWAGDRRRMEITFDGKVIIGQDADFVSSGVPTFPDASLYKLFVATGILTPKVKCALASTNDWKDYVLAPDYKLKSLTEVESFIKTNQHLPNVPSANDLVKSGIDLVKMDATLLEKIEELTLYVISLEKKVKALEEAKK